MKKRKRSQLVTEKNVSGVVNTTYTNFTIDVSSEQFFMLFTKNLQVVLDITSLVATKVFLVFCAISELNTGNIYLSSKRRSAVQNRLKITKQQMSNAISELKHRKLLHGDRGTYSLNPNISWRGHIVERDEKLKVLGAKYEFNIQFNIIEDVNVALVSGDLNMTNYPQIPQNIIDDIKAIIDVE